MSASSSLDPLPEPKSDRNSESRVHPAEDQNALKVREVLHADLNCSEYESDSERPNQGDEGDPGSSDACELNPDRCGDRAEYLAENDRPGETLDSVAGPEKSDGDPE